YFSTFPQFLGITELATGATSGYNSFQASLRTTAWHGLTSQFNYTLGHVEDEQSYPRNHRLTNNYDRNFDFGNADFDVRHIFGGSVVYDVPQLGHSLPRLTRGWQLNMLLTYDSGMPFTVTSGSKDRSNTKNKADRVDVKGDPFSGLTMKYQFFNTGAFSLPAL